jgi:hypothetical protein
MQTESLYSRIWMVSQLSLSISACCAKIPIYISMARKRAWPLFLNENVCHNKQVCSSMSQYFILIYHIYFSVTVYDKQNNTVMLKSISYDISVLGTHISHQADMEPQNLIRHEIQILEWLYYSLYTVYVHIQHKTSSYKTLLSWGYGSLITEFYRRGNPQTRHIWINILTKQRLGHHCHQTGLHHHQPKNLLVNHHLTVMGPVYISSDQ